MAGVTLCNCGSGHRPPLQLRKDRVGEFARSRLSPQVARDRLALFQHLVQCRFHAVAGRIFSDMTQHHDGRHKKGRWIGEILSRDIRSGAVHRFEECCFLA